MSTQSIGFDIFARDRASATFDKVGSKVKDNAGFFERHKAAVVAGAAAAGAAVVKFGADSVSAYVDAEKSQRVLEDAYKRFPALANVSIDALRDQAAALQNKTKFDGDNINAMQGSLAAYKLTGSQIRDLTPLILDYAEKTGRDLPSAAAVVGKAMLGQGRALKDVGINFKDTGSTAGNFTQLMGGLRTQVGGFAEKEGKSAEGQAEILKNNFGDLQEEVGSKLLPVGQKLIGWLIKGVDWIQRNSDTIQRLIPFVGGLAVAIGTLMVINKVRNAMLLLNVVLAANPIGLVVTAIAALVAGLIYAYKNSETFRNIVNAAFSVVKVAALNLARVAVTAFQFMANIWMEVVHTLLVGAAKAFGWVPGVGPKLEGAAKAFGRFKDSANAKLDGIRKGIDIEIKKEQADKSLAAFYKKWSGKTLQIKANAHADVGNYRGGAYGGGQGGGLGRPVSNPIGTGFGGYPGHKGVDFLTPFGTPVRAPMSGTVIRDGWDTGGFGVHVRTRDSDGNYTILGHLSKEIVSVGQRLTKGQIIGYSGSTGNSSGPHLHMERRHGTGPDSAYNFTGALSRARGGPVWPGGAFKVGDNPDGSINSTTELFVPKRPGYIIPSSQLAAALSGGGGPQTIVLKVILDGRQIQQSLMRLDRIDGG